MMRSDNPDASTPHDNNDDVAEESSLRLELHPRPDGLYFAVRRGGTGVENCIFASWDKCRPHVVGEWAPTVAVDYKAFDDLNDAAAYAFVVADDDGGPPSARDYGDRKKAKEVAVDGTDADAGGTGVDGVARNEKALKRSLESSAVAQKKCKRAKNRGTTGSEVDYADEEGETRVASTAKRADVTGRWKGGRANYIARGRSSDWSVAYLTRSTLRRCASTEKGPHTPPKSKEKKKQKKASVVAPVASENDPRRCRAKKSVSSWDERLEQLRAYEAEHGDANVPPRSRRNRVLGAWLRKQKEEYRKMQQGKRSSMTAEKAAALEEVGIVWENKNCSESVTWEDRLEELRAYREKKGDTNVPQKNGKLGRLGRWAQNQRIEYEKVEKGMNSWLTADRVSALEDLGFVWRVEKSATWEERFEQLREYSEFYGDTNVPRNYPPNQAFSNWVNSLRSEYRKMEQGLPSQLTPKRVAALEEIEFTCRSRNATWEERLEELRQYKMEHGDCNASNRTALGRWVSHTREQYRRMQQGEKPIKDMEARVAALNEIGFQWRIDTYVQKASWDERFEELRAYKAEHGVAHVPRRCQLNPTLASWVHRQRQDYAKMQQGRRSAMTAERIAALESLGFVWRPRERLK